MASLLRTASKLRSTATAIIHNNGNNQRHAIRRYVTRAHPEATPQIPVIDALSSLLLDADARHALRSQRWEADQSRRLKQRIEYLSRRSKPSHPSSDDIKKQAEQENYRRMDETIELALQLNLDPRKPGQSLRGSLALPHGNGKRFAVAVFTHVDTLATRAKEEGAVAAGGTSLVESIKNGDTSLTTFDRVLATPEIMTELSSIARLLGPKGLMPNPKLNTIVPSDSMLEALSGQMSGISNYRTDKSGIVRVALGKASFGVEKLAENVRELMNEIQAVKPENFGKGKKGKGGAGKGTKYYLKAHLSSTQSKRSWLVDMRTVDPTSVFFMSSIG